MDLKEIQNLIKFVSKSGVNEVKIETEGLKLTIKTGEVKSATTIIQGGQAMPMMQAPIMEQVPAAASAIATTDSSQEDDSKYITIKSPMIGTFYIKPSPDKPHFVSIGDTVTPESVVFIVEAMKLFNEIESEVSGKIVKILVDDATPVEFDQPLFLVDPS